jgi:hypothetical protein
MELLYIWHLLTLRHTLIMSNIISVLPDKFVPYPQSSDQVASLIKPDPSEIILPPPAEPVSHVSILSCGDIRHFYWSTKQLFHQILLILLWLSIDKFYIWNIARLIGSVKYLNSENWLMSSKPELMVHTFHRKRWHTFHFQRPDWENVSQYHRHQVRYFRNSKLEKFDRKSF